MKNINEQLKLTKNELSSGSGEFSDTKIKERDTKSTDEIIKKIKDINNDITLTSEVKIEKLGSLLENLKAQESLWQELSEEEKNIYKSLNPGERKEYLNLDPEERDFYLKHPQLRDRLLEGKIKLLELTVGERNKEQIQKELDERGKITDYNNPDQITVGDIAQKLLNHPDFKISKEKKELKLTKLSVADLGFPDGAKFQEIIAKGKELGLELCPPEVGPLLRLNYQKLMGHDQPKGECIFIAMNPISVSSGSSDYPSVFYVYRDDDGERYLYCDWANPDHHFDADFGFLFVRK